MKINRFEHWNKPPPLYSASLSQYKGFQFIDFVIAKRHLKVISRPINNYYKFE